MSSKRETKAMMTPGATSFVIIRSAPSQSVMNPPLKSAQAIQYGFKQISRTNLLKHDEHPAYPSRLKSEKWVEACLKPRLAPTVPDEVAFLFEVARGSMVYGMFFLPLASLATEQSFRV